jgi:hypothetical protein
MLSRSFVAVLVVAALSGCIAAAPTPTPGPTGAPTLCCPPTVPPTGTPGPTVQPTAPPTLQPTAQPTGQPLTAGLIIDWQEHLDNGLGAIYQIADMTVANGRYVAVGMPELSGPGVWYSDDGLHWTAATVAGDTGFSIQAVAAGEPGFVGVGDDYSGAANTGVVYVSADGQAWERVDSPLFAGNSLHDIATAAGTLVAFSQQGGVFVSADGHTWQAPADPGAAEVADGLLDLAQADGALWAFSRDGDGSRPAKQKIGVWQTVDGLTWTRTAIIDESHNAFTTAAAAGPFGLALSAEMQRRDSTRYRAWYSADGTAWQPALNAPAHASQMVADDAGFIAVGWYNTGQGCALSEEDDVAETWTSVDGLAWRQMPEQGWNAREIGTLLVTGRTALALGIDWTLWTNEGAPNALVLTAELPPIAQDEGQAPEAMADVTNPEGCG